MKLIAQNKKAYHDYFIEDTLEAGIELFGTEVKSVRAGKVNLRDAYCTVRNGEVFLLGMHISPYDFGNVFNKDPLRERKLLLHRREIFRLHTKKAKDGYAIVPTKLYFGHTGKVKVEIGIAKGKKLHDKRASLAKKESEKSMKQAMKEYNQRI